MGMGSRRLELLFLGQESPFPSDPEVEKGQWSVWEAPASDGVLILGLTVPLLLDPTLNESLCFEVSSHVFSVSSVTLRCH